MSDEETTTYLQIIAEIADAYEVPVYALRGHSRKAELVDARAAAAQALRGHDLTYVAIGNLLNRDSTSVRQLLRRRLNPPPTGRKPKALAAAPRDETERLFNKMCKAGARALARAIFETGKLHGPMSEEAQAEAVKWSNEGPKLTAIGWMQ